MGILHSLVSIVLSLWSMPIVKKTVIGAIVGAGTGAAGAARSDWDAYQKFKDEDEFNAYNWKTARFRWKRGALVGAATGSGLGALLGGVV